jgi:hypothetical protein
MKYIYVNKRHPKSFVVADEKLSELEKNYDVYEVDEVPENHGVYDFINGEFILNNKILNQLKIENKKIEIDNKKLILNQQRDKELKGFTIDNIFLNKEIIKDMAVKYTTLGDDEKAHWIDLDNKVVELTKAELGVLVKQGTDKVEAIYFKYRQLKDEIETQE